MGGASNLEGAYHEDYEDLLAINVETTRASRCGRIMRDLCKIALSRH